jgi:phage terminase large subunit
MPALRMTLMRMFLQILDDMKLYATGVHNKSANTFTFSNGSLIQFFSLDDPQKLKSSEYCDIWLEEANEFSWEDYLIASDRLSAKPVISASLPPSEKKRLAVNRMFLSLNPNEASGWIPKKLLIQKNVELIHSTYHDNPMLSPEYIATLEQKKDLDPVHYKIYTLGEWGVLRGMIYNNFKICETWPDSFDTTVYGIDFGFNNPTAVVEVNFKDRICYVREIVYKSGLTTAQMLGLMETAIPAARQRGTLIMADSAEPDRIKEIQDAGWNCQPVEKVQNSVKAGIDLCRQQRFMIHPDSEHLNYEFERYHWRTDKAGEPLDEPAKFDDHLLDAMRYAISSLRQELGDPMSAKGESDDMISRLRIDNNLDRRNDDLPEDVPNEGTIPSFASGLI